MRIVFIGAVAFSAHVLKRLLDLNAEIVGICTLESGCCNADHVDLAPLARSAGIPVRYTPDINAGESVDWISALQPDIIFCFGWSRLIKKSLLELAPMGVVGFHPAALPANRGRHPIIWALVLGLSETASSFFFMDEGADSGDIISQAVVPINENDDAEALYRRITVTAIEQLEDFLPLLASGKYPRSPQDHALANVWRKRGRVDGQIDWRMPATGIYNLVRGLARPYVGAHFVHQGVDVKVWSCRVAGGTSPNLEPGKVVELREGRPTVKAGIGAVELIEFEPAPRFQLGDYL